MKLKTISSGRNIEKVGRQDGSSRKEEDSSRCSCRSGSSSGRSSRRRSSSKSSSRQ